MNNQIKKKIKERYERRLQEQNDTHQLLLLLDSFENLKNIADEYLDRGNFKECEE